MKYALRTIRWRFEQIHEPIPELKGKRNIVIRSPHDLYDNFQSLFKEQVKERFVVFWLDSANKLLGFEIITEGLLNSSLTHPREVFRGAIVTSSASLIVAHNHPSGNTQPSREDIAITKQLVEAGKIIGIPIHDHIIFTDETFTSMTEQGLM